MATPAKDKASIALGVAVVTAVFTMETIVAHRFAPNPLSPYVWTGLGLLFAGAIAAFFRFRALAKRIAAERDGFARD
jgi:hypothetical protein